MYFSRKFLQWWTYYWEFLKRFGEESSLSWFRVIWASIALIPIFLFLTWPSDKHAWDTARLGLEGNFVFYSLIVIFQLARTPYLLHRERSLPEYEGERIVRALYGVYGIGLLCLLVAISGYWIVKPWIGQSSTLVVMAPTTPQIILGNQTASDPPRGPANLGKLPQATSPTPARMTASPSATVQPSTQTGSSASQSAAPQTQLDRVVQTDRNLTPDDRNRLSNALYDYSQVLDSGTTLGYKVFNELGKINQDLQSTNLVTNVDVHIKTLHDITPLAKEYYKTLEQTINKGRYYSDQTDYIFGDNPYNLGPNAIINTTEGFANYLTDWAKAANRKEVLNLVSPQANDYNQMMTRFMQWVQGCRQRLDQVKRSIQPNGVVQPIPSSTPAPATGMFTVRTANGAPDGHTEVRNAAMN